MSMQVYAISMMRHQNINTERSLTWNNELHWTTQWGRCDGIFAIINQISSVIEIELWLLQNESKMLKNTSGYLRFSNGFSQSENRRNHQCGLHQQWLLTAWTTPNNWFFEFILSQQNLSAVFIFQISIRRPMSACVLVYAVCGWRFASALSGWVSMGELNRARPIHTLSLSCHMHTHRHTRRKQRGFCIQCACACDKDTK